jgi:hypothetical protein
MSDTIFIRAEVGSVKPGLVSGELSGEDDVGVVLMGGQPDWVLDPITGAKVRFLFFSPPTDLECPKCGVMNHGAHLMICEADQHPSCAWVILQCAHCKQFVGRLTERDSN